jgi:hypothetical protein
MRPPAVDVGRGDAEGCAGERRGGGDRAREAFRAFPVGWAKGAPLRSAGLRPPVATVRLVPAAGSKVPAHAPRPRASPKVPAATLWETPRASAG